MRHYFIFMFHRGAPVGSSSDRRESDGPGTAVVFVVRYAVRTLVLVDASVASRKSFRQPECSWPLLLDSTRLVSAAFMVGSSSAGMESLEVPRWLRVA